MTASEERNSPRHAQSFEGLETPFLNEELFRSQAEDEWQGHLSLLEFESPFLGTFKHPGTQPDSAEMQNAEAFEDEGDDQEYDEEFYDQEMEQWEKQVAPSSSAPIETKFIDKATSARWLQKVDKAVRNHFKLGPPSLSGRVQFVTQAQFAKQFPGSAIFEDLLLLFLNPPLRVIQILRQHGKELLGGGEFDSAEGRLRKLKKFIAERIKIGSFFIE